MYTNKLERFQIALNYKIQHKKRFKMMRTFKKKMLVRGSEGHVGTD